MNIIKIILAVLGIVFGVIAFFWLLGLISSLLWYGFWVGLLAAVGYGGYRMFRKAEDRALRGGSASALGNVSDYDMSWEEYEGKYLSK
ncbi:MAG: hypothetical protein H7070_02915 [Saprospiraceae bacterium]|nr:hypothetical protein [Pyrinomonadaceae bacterium]